MAPALSSTERLASGPPISVRTQPGDTSSIARGSPARRPANAVAAQGHPPAPEVTGQFTMDYGRGRLIPMRDHNIEIIEANLAGVTFTIQ